MKNTKPHNLSKILESFIGKRIIVLGDIMLDEYLWGRVQRISPEAPVPVVEITRQEFRLGGAANVALNLAALGAKVQLVGVCGKDAQGKALLKLMKQHKLSTSGIVTDPQRPTTHKTRIGAVNQQIVRLDKESTDELPIELREIIEDYLQRQMTACDAVIIEDYDKGLLSSKLIEHVKLHARRNKLPIAVDPKLKNFSWYGGVDILKPNYAELQAYMNKRFEAEEDFIKSAESMLKTMNPKHLVVTRGSKGMFVFSTIEKPKHLPSFAREVFDVSGAGDTVISALTLAYLYDHNIENAALIANHAAAVVVAKHGTACVTAKEIWDSFHDPD